MNDLVSTVLQSYNHQTEEKKFQVEVGVLPKIDTDRLASEQIISNLVDNAIKYMPSGQAGLIGINCIDDGNEYHFSVQDNGRGIAAGDQEKIFEIFKRAGQQNVPGDGMGLAYVRALLKKLGGRVWCESELGVGTKMMFSLPKQSEFIISL